MTTSSEVDYSQLLHCSSQPRCLDQIRKYLPVKLSTDKHKLYTVNAMQTTVLCHVTILSAPQYSESLRQYFMWSSSSVEGAYYNLTTT